MGTKAARTWSVKGIDSSARAAAKRAAQARGMTLGEWLNEMILTRADDTDAKGRPPRRASRCADDDIAGKLDDLATQLRALSRRDQDTAVARFAALSDEEAAAMSALAERVERNEQHLAQSLRTINQRLDELAARMAEQDEAAPAPQRPEDVPGYAELETALRNVVDHLEVSENRTAQTLARLQERLEQVAAQAAEAAQDRPDEQSARAFMDLESRLEQLNSRLSSLQAEAGEQVRAYVDEHMGALAERVNAVHMVSQALPEKMESMIGQVTGEKLSEAEARLEGMVSSLRGKLEDMATNALDVSRIDSEMESLNRKLDDLSARAASMSDVEAMRQAIGQLSAAVEGKADRAEVDSLNARIDALLEQMEKERAEGGYLPQISALETKVRELEEAMREAAANAAGPDAVAALQAHVAGLDSRLQQAEQQVSAMPALQNAIATLQQSLEGVHEASRQTAEETAMRIAADMAPSAPADSSAEIAALKQGLEAIRASSETANAQTKDTLAAVHETLEHIIGKLNALEEAQAREQQEKAAQTQPQPQPETAPAAHDALSAAHAAGIDLTMPEMPDLHAPQAAAPEAAQQDMGNMAAAAMPGNDTAAAHEPQTGQPQIKEDFIAAARRAAMAASGSAGEAGESAGGLLGRLRGKARQEKHDPSVIARPQATADTGRGMPGGHPLPGSAPLQDAGEEKKGLFSLSFLNRGKKDAADKPQDAASGDSGDKGQADGGKRRLVLAGLVLLMAAGAFFVNQRSAQPPRVQTPAIETPASESPASGPAGKAQAPGAHSPQKTPQDPEASSGARDPAARAAPGKKADAGFAGELSQKLASLGNGTAARSAADASGGAEPFATASLGQVAAVSPANGPRAMSIPAAIGTPALRMAASSGDPKAQFIVASAWLRGRGVKRDFAKAAQWYAKAAAKGLAVAQYRLGTLYERGRGLPHDMAKARHWYEQAARAGNVKAMHNLAVILANNTAGKADYAASAHWFRMAAEHGLRDSQYNMAVLYQRGLGVKADLAEAYKWFALAARSGDMDAAQRKAALAGSLGAQTKAAMDRQINSWKPRKAIQEANVVTIDKPEWRIRSSAAKSAERLDAASAMPLTRTQTIRKMQELLTRLGYDAGPADGKMGNRTANAIRLFQLQSGLPVNGQPSAQVLQLLQARAASPSA